MAGCGVCVIACVICTEDKVCDVCVDAVCDGVR